MSTDGRSFKRIVRPMTLGVAAVAAHPETMREDRRGGSATHIVFRQEITAAQRRGSQQPEGVMRNMGPEDELGGVPVIADVEPDREHPSDPVERLVRGAPVLEVEK